MNLNFDFNLGMSKKSKIITASILGVAGILFIIFSQYIASTIIRLVMLTAAIGLGFYIYRNFKEANWVRRLYMIAGEVALVASLVFPYMLIMISGIALLGYALYKLYLLIIKNGNNLNVPMLIVNLILVLIARTLIMNSSVAVGVVVKFLGGIMLAISVGFFYNVSKYHR